MLHLFHPALVHFSVAFLVAGCLAEAGGLLSGKAPLVRWGQVLVVLGGVSLLPTIVSGYLAANTLAFDHLSGPVLAVHERNGWLLAGLVLACLVWKGWAGGTIPPGQAVPYAALLLMVVVMTVWSAWLGGRMVYGQGVGVLAPPPAAGGPTGAPGR